MAIRSGEEGGKSVEQDLVGLFSAGVGGPSVELYPSGTGRRIAAGGVARSLKEQSTLERLEFIPRAIELVVIGDLFGAMVLFCGRSSESLHNLFGAG